MVAARVFLFLLIETKLCIDARELSMGVIK
jgi:hypothetical protein